MNYITTRAFFLALFLLIGWEHTCQAQKKDDDPPTTRVIILGNAKDALRHNPAFLEAVRQSQLFDAGTLVLFAGNSMAGPGDTASLRHAAGIIDGSEARAVFLPGYTDWAEGGNHGYRALLDEQKFLKSLDNDRIKCAPNDGCPGPKKIDLGNDALLILMDSQWWLHAGEKPGLESDCRLRTRGEILSEIEDIPKDEMDKLVLFATYHPLENTGIHSGTFGLKQHLFPLTDSRTLRNAYVPLPILGSLYPMLSNAISARQDLQNPDYQSLAKVGITTLAGITRAFENHPNTIFIAGQEHNLQLLEDDGHYFINSGAIGRPSRVRNNRHARYVNQAEGFAVLEIGKDKQVHTRFYVVKDGKAVEDFSTKLLDYSQLPPLAKDTTTRPMVTGDSTLAAVNTEIGDVGLLKRVLIGKNYRREWSALTRMPVLHVDRIYGGMKLKGVGGGHESKSLQMTAADGAKWVFRTSNKDLRAVIPEGFQQTVASDYVQDMLSGSYPYGSTVVKGLQRSLGITESWPQLYFMPNDTALGIYRPLFANQVGVLEERKPARNDRGQISSTEMLDHMIDAGDHTVDQRAYLRVRLLDFLIADFDRHHGQYSWGMTDSAGRTWYYPIPKDRDQAFYNNRGLVINVLRHGPYRFMVNFPYKIKSIQDAGIVGAYLDVLFTNKLTRNDWDTVIRAFSADLTDAAIDSATRLLPPEQYAMRGPLIATKLKSRRGSIDKKAISYYDFVSRKVNIMGGNGEDVFHISRADRGIRLQVTTRDSNDRDLLVYDRAFTKGPTRELRLYGFNGDDRFVVDPDVRSGIRLRIIGGPGKDTFDMQGRIRNELYDLRFEDNALLNRRRTTRMFAKHNDVNDFQLREPLHDAFDLPLVTFGFNVDDGIIGGIGLAYRGYGFRNAPYASIQRLTASFASTSLSYMLRYKGEFNHLWRHNDLLVNVDLFKPVLKNFFGFGNETVRDKSQRISWYRTRYNYLSADVLGRKRFYRSNIMSLSAGPTMFYYWYNEQSNRGRVLEENPQVLGLDSATIHAQRLYAGGRAAFTINTQNSDLLPTRGIYWNTDFLAMQGLTGAAKPYSRLLSTLDIYAELDRPNRLLAALHFGGGQIFSDNVEYFQALTLGGNNYLRGYRVNRFAGTAMAYASAELKVKLFSFNAYLLKGDLGVVGFNDVGRVWMRGEKSDRWHYGYGGGFYLVPFNTLMVSALVGFSEEDRVFNFSIGTRLNLVFQGI